MKKIISTMVAAVVASVIAAAPASAVPTFSVTVNGGSNLATSAQTSTTPATVTVPSDNKVNAADAVKFELTGIETGSVVSVSATNASIVTALHDDAAPVTAAAGSSTYSVNTGTGTSVTFYVFTKTTTTGSVVVTNGGSTWTYYVKGTAGPAYNLAVSLATAGYTSQVLDGTATLTDVFGNLVSETYSVTAINGTVAGVAQTLSTTGADAFTVTLPATTGTAALQFKIAADPADVTGLAKAVKTVDKFVTITDLSAVNAALVAQNKALADELAATKAALASEQAAHLATKAAATKAAADSATAASAVKAASDKAIADLTDALAKTKAAYNRMAKKFKFAIIK